MEGRSERLLLWGVLGSVREELARQEASEACQGCGQHGEQPILGQPHTLITVFFPSASQSLTQP